MKLLLICFQKMMFYQIGLNLLKNFYLGKDYQHVFVGLVTAKEKSFDVVFCTVGIAPGASPETGFEIARLTKPQVAVPYHTNSAANQQKFAEILKKELPRSTDAGSSTLWSGPTSNRVK
jgi:hypothetical protein